MRTRESSKFLTIYLDAGSSLEKTECFLLSSILYLTLSTYHLEGGIVGTNGAIHEWLLHFMRITKLEKLHDYLNGHE